MSNDHYVQSADVNRVAKWPIRMLVVGLLTALVALGLAWHTYYRAANLTETVMVLSNVSGADIEVVYANSDTLAKQEDMSVYISASNGSRSWIPKRFRTKTLLFRYDPRSPDNPLPSITSPGPGRLIIAVPRLSSVLSQRTQWGGISVTYKIGRIDYP